MKTNHKSFLIQSNKGFSLVESMVGLFVLLVVGLGTVVALKQFAEMRQDIEVPTAASYLHADLQNRARKLMFDVADPAVTNGRNHLAGLCRIMRTDSKSFGVGKITLDLRPNAFLTAVPAARWNQMFGPAWGVNNDIVPNCPNQAFCKKIVANRDHTFFKDFESSQIEITDAYVRITPVDLNPLDGDTFEPISLSNANAVDSKQVAFVMETEVHYKKKSTVPAEASQSTSQASQPTVVEEPKVSFMKNMAWAADVEYCDFQLSPTEWARLFPSGSGLGDPIGLNVYNSTLYVDKDQDPIEITVQKRAIRKGFIDDENFMQADITKNIEVACVENSYRCPSSSAARTFGNTVNFRAGVRYYPNNRFNNPTTARFNLGPQIISPAGEDLLANRRDRLRYNALTVTFREQNDRMLQLDTDGNITTRELTVGRTGVRTQIDVNIEDAAPLCQTMCSGANLNRDYKMRFNYALYGFMPNGGDYRNSTTLDTPIGCTGCFMKGCARFGIEVFGDLKHQPPEPIDSGVPECAAGNVALRSQLDPYASLSNPDPNSCVLAEMDGAGTIRLTTADCGERHPVMCFNYGRFMVARNFNSHKNFDVPMLPFEAASRRCFEMSRERGLKSDLTGLFTNTGQTFPVPIASFPGNSTDYDFYNVAKQGAFFAPESAEQFGEAARNVSELTPSVTRFWVAARVNSRGEILVEPPRLTAQSAASERYAVFYNVRGVPTMFDSNSQSLPASASASGNAALLFHDIKYKGVMRVASTQAGSFRFLCRRAAAPHDFYVTSSGSNSAANGPSFCGSDGLFLPPNSSAGWAQAMQLAAASHTGLPFPDPAANPRPISRPIWVAVSLNDGQPWQLPSGLPYFAQLFSASLIESENAQRKNAYENCMDNEKKANEELPEGEEPGPSKCDKPNYFSVEDSQAIDREGRWHLPPVAPNMTICEDGQGVWRKRSAGGCPNGEKRISQQDLQSGSLSRLKWAFFKESLSASDAIDVKE